jgi:PilZ domain
MRLGRAKPREPAPIVLPDRSDVVTIATRQGGRLPARVLERGSDTVLLAVTVPTRPFSAGDLDDMLLEFNSPRGRTTLHGSFEVEDPVEPDVLRMRDPRSVEVVQERNYVRIAATRPVVVYGGAGAAKVESYTVDLSGGGMLLAGPDTLAVGEEIRFRLALTSDHSVTGVARVVRIDRQGRRAVAFQEISDLDRRRVVHFIFECQRTERHLGLSEEDRGGR